MVPAVYEPLRMGMADRRLALAQLRKALEPLGLFPQGIAEDGIDEAFEEIPPPPDEPPPPQRPILDDGMTAIVGRPPELILTLLLLLISFIAATVIPLIIVNMSN